MQRVRADAPLTRMQDAPGARRGHEHGRFNSWGISWAGVLANDKMYASRGIPLLQSSHHMNHLWSPWRMEYIENHGKQGGCVFCNAVAAPDNAENLIVYRGKLAFVILNRYPYTSGHVMVVPFEHKPNLEQLDVATRGEMIELTSRSTTVLRTIYNTQAFNVGLNIGEAAGAGVKEHVHIHVVPRWNGDTNFMSSLAETRVLPELLEDTWQRIRVGFQG
jgi:ATP adenylyltransferase